MPPGVRRALIVAVVIVLAGAIYLIAARGETLLADLSALARACF